MIKKIIIDIRPIVLTLFERYNNSIDSNLNFKQWLKQEKKDIINKVKHTLLSLPLHYQPSKIELKNDSISTIEIVLTFQWSEDINVNEWFNTVNIDLLTIQNYYHNKQIYVYKAS